MVSEEPVAGVCGASSVMPVVRRSIAGVWDRVWNDIDGSVARRNVGGGWEGPDEDEASCRYACSG